MVLNCFRCCFCSINSAWFIQPRIVFAWLLSFTLLVELIGFLLVTFFPVLHTTGFGIICLAPVVFRMAILIVEIPRPIPTQMAEYLRDTKWFEAAIYISYVVTRMGLGKVPDSMAQFILLGMVTNSVIAHASMIHMLDNIDRVVSRSIKIFTKIASTMIMAGAVYPIAIYYVAMFNDSKTAMGRYIPSLYWYLIYLTFSTLRVIVSAISWGVFVIPPEVLEVEMNEVVIQGDGQINVASAPNAAKSSAEGEIPPLDSLARPLLSNDQLGRRTSQATAV